MPTDATHPSAPPAGYVLATEIDIIAKASRAAHITSFITGWRAAEERFTALPAVPAGWKLVPVEPTPEMVEAICAEHTASRWPQDFGDSARAIRRKSAVAGYRAMLSAVPSAPASKDLGVAADAAGLSAPLRSTAIPDAAGDGLSAWQPIETAPEDVLVVVGWLDPEDAETPERHDFDWKEDGLWRQYTAHVEHAEMVAPPGSRMPPASAPYTHWMALPPIISQVLP